MVLAPLRQPSSAPALQVLVRAGIRVNHCSSILWLGAVSSGWCAGKRSSPFMVECSLDVQRFNSFVAGQEAEARPTTHGSAGSKQVSRTNPVLQAVELRACRCKGRRFQQSADKEH